MFNSRLSGFWIICLLLAVCTCNAEDGINKEDHRVNILEINTDGSNEKIYASDLRNPCGMGWVPGTNTLWTTVNERDELGDELVPDYFTHVEEGGFYGWPLI